MNLCLFSDLYTGIIFEIFNCLGTCPDDRDKLTGHSFRSGLATLMEAAGFSEEDIKAWARWSSDAFARYCKENRPRVKIFSALFAFIR